MYKLPIYYKGVAEIDALLNSLDLTQSNILVDIEKLKNELFITTAQNDGLNVWSDTLLTSTDKRDILTKLRGVKTINKVNLSLIVKDILKQDTNVDIIELNESYRVIIGVYTPNLNIEGIQNLLRQELRYIIPSHIELLLYVNSLVWDRFDLYNKSFNSWDELDLKWDELEKYNKEVV